VVLPRRWTRWRKAEAAVRLAGFDFIPDGKSIW
jgi:hypothetical protein